MTLTFDQVLRVVETVGFPTAVALWFMFRTDGKIEANTKALTDMTVSFNSLREALKK